MLYTLYIFGLFSDIDEVKFQPVYIKIINNKVIMLFYSCNISSKGFLMAF